MTPSEQRGRNFVKQAATIFGIRSVFKETSKQDQLVATKNPIAGWARCSIYPNPVQQIVTVAGGYKWFS